MTNKEAIKQVYNSGLLENCHIVFRTSIALDIVLALASRMAMYEWYWKKTLDANLTLGHGIVLNEEDEARVMKAWKENA